MAELSNLRIAVLATDGFEEVELTEPAKALKDAGARVDIISPKGGPIQAFRHYDKSTTVPVDVTLDQARADDYDAVMLPGGALNADALRAVPEALRFIQAIARADKPMPLGSSYRQGWLAGAHLPATTPSRTTCATPVPTG